MLPSNDYWSEMLDAKLQPHRADDGEARWLTQYRHWREAFPNDLVLIQVAAILATGRNVTVVCQHAPIGGGIMKRLPKVRWVGFRTRCQIQKADDPAA